MTGHDWTWLQISRRGKKLPMFTRWPWIDGKAPTGVPCGKLRPAIYDTSDVPKMFGASFSRHRFPCAVCESQMQATKLMIPAKVRCPNSDWVIEYKGFIMSAAEHIGDQGFFSDDHFRTSYVCVDDKPESVTSKPATGSFFGGLLHPVSALCSGDETLANCPPYFSDDRALSCVICTKWDLFCYPHLFFAPNICIHLANFAPCCDCKALPCIVCTKMKELSPHFMRGDKNSSSSVHKFFCFHSRISAHCHPFHPYFPGAYAGIIKNLKSPSLLLKFQIFHTLLLIFVYQWINYFIMNVHLQTTST